MKLEKIKVEGLYGTFTHEVKFNVEDKITLLIGENGLGKTVILRMIKCFFDQDFTELKTLYFKVFTLFFSNEITIVITRSEKEEKVNLVIEYSVNGRKKDKPFIPKDVISRRHFRNSYRYETDFYYQPEIIYDYDSIIDTDLDYTIEKFLPFPLRRISPGIWYDPRRKREFTTYELIDRYRDHFPPDFKEKFVFPQWLRDLTEGTKVRIVEAQRLLNRIKTEDGKYKSAVVEFSQEITDKIKTLRAAASDLASKLDRTYPKRLLEKISFQENITSDQIVASLQTLEEKRRLLNTVGLIDTEEVYIQPYAQLYEDNQIKSVLMLYINDSNEKLGIYDDLEKRISLFLNIINRRFLYKTFKIDKQAGFTFKSSVNNTEIPLTGLSSGEQHELVLFYQLLFNTNPNSLLLIDEPEISLHISWQKQFIGDLKEVIKINDLDIIIATHSPDIINNYWILATQLDGSNISTQ